MKSEFPLALSASPKSHFRRESIERASRLLVTIMLMSSLLGCGPNREKQALNRIAGLLIDPSSAQFESVRTLSERGAICGRVNGKNRLGGYVGFRSFVVTDEAAIIHSGRDLMSEIRRIEREVNEKSLHLPTQWLTDKIAEMREVREVLKKDEVVARLCGT